MVQLDYFLIYNDMVTMECVPSAVLKKDFGRVMDEVQHTPVTVTRHGRNIATIFSNKKLEEAAEKLLWEYFLEKVKNGEIDLLEALEQEAMIMNDVKKAREDMANGRVTEVTDDYFDNLKARVYKKNNITQ